jgi:hypothetical protein
MAFVVEDGTGLANATSYLAVADADAYHVDMGNASWALASNANKQSALIRATKSLDAMYNGQWKGLLYSSTQALAWPRTEARNELDDEYTGVPVILKNATAEGALIELGTPGALLISKERGGLVKMEKVDVITIEYQDGAPGATSYPTIASVISPLLESGGAGSLKTYRG